MSGTLYIVATPIGNLEDVTYRAVRVLGEVDRIACEDTRQTRKLLDRYGISRPLVSYHEHNEQARSDALLRDLEAGMNIALVSDAGTPLVSDPGYRLVQAAREKGIAVSPIPGPSAILASLCVSGLPTDSFLFLGFLPAKSGQRRALLEQYRTIPATLVCYEAPHRVLETLEDLGAVLGPRPVMLARELTKIHEEFLQGTPAELAARLRERGLLKGEITLIVGKGDGAPADDQPLDESVEKLIQAGLSRMDALKTIARQRGLSKRDVYKQVTKRGQSD
jgi:16S rRNA (cytidine1402-2'-O)-methyltransferase